MAKNKKQQVTDEPIALDVQLSKGEAFIEKNWKKIAIVLGAIIVIVAGVYTYKHYMAGKELEADSEKFFHFEWNIVDIDESHIYVTNKSNGHRYHVSVIYPAALYVDVFSIEDDGTEIKAFP